MSKIKIICTCIINRYLLTKKNGFHYAFMVKKKASAFTNLIVLGKFYIVNH